MQLIHVIQAAYSQQNHDYGKVQITDKDGLDRMIYDQFNLEDQDLLKFLEAVLQEKKTQ